MPNFCPILFKFCAYVNYMLIYNMNRERKFPMAITNLAALFLELFGFEPSSYMVLKKKWPISFNLLYCWETRFYLPQYGATKFVKDEVNTSHLNMNFYIQKVFEYPRLMV